MSFKFEIKQNVRVVVSGETGQIQGRAEYAAAENSYLVRYKQTNGVATESWWQESALEDAPV